MSSTETYNGKQCDQYANDKPIEVMCFCHTLLIFSVSIKNAEKHWKGTKRSRWCWAENDVGGEKRRGSEAPKKNLEGIIGKWKQLFVIA